MVWVPERLYERSTQHTDGSFNLIVDNSEASVYPTGTWVSMKIEVTKEQILRWVKVDGGEWELAAASERGAQQQGAPTAIAVGKGATAYGMLMRSHASEGNPGTTYVDYVSLRVDGEE